jgi:type I restriction enzyme M protein
MESNTLYLVIKEFNSQKGYLGADKISAVDCGYIFEDLVRRFSESIGEEAGAHFTSRDIIYLMTDLLLSDADLSRGGNVTVYDMAMGTSQMLGCMEERIHELNSEMDVTCFGQEFNPSTFAIAKADMMIRGGDPNNMRFGDTLSEDQFSGYKFQYMTRYFYEYQAPERVEDIMQRLTAIESDIQSSLDALFGGGKE